jgi:hypothetical protein
MNGGVFRSRKISPCLGKLNGLENSNPVEQSTYRGHKLNIHLFLQQENFRSGRN